MTKMMTRNPTWCKRRISLERCLTVSTALLCLIGISQAKSPAAVLYNKINAPANDDKQSLCLTSGCVQAAAKVLENMDLTVDPCENFYQFTCGNFIKRTNIPDDKSSVSQLTIISDELKEQLRTIIEEPIKENEPKPFQLTKKLYRACMNTTRIEEQGVTVITDILKKLGGWPALEGEKWEDGNFNWRESVSRFRKAGYDYNLFMEFGVAIDLKNSNKSIIYLDEASLGLSREFLNNGLDDKVVKAYYDYMVDIAVLLGADRDRAENELKQSLEFEIKLANMSLPNEKRLDPNALYNPMTIQELQNKFPSIPWLNYINSILEPDAMISNDEVIVVAVPEYISDLEVLIAGTPNRTKANYVMWRAVQDSVEYSTETLRKRKLDYTTILTGTTERKSRWKECIDVSAGSLSSAIGALYVRKYFNETTRQNAKEILADIRAAFQEIIKNVDWMDEKTKQTALDKTKAMTEHIGYPDELLDDKILEDFYTGLELNENEYLDNLNNLELFWDSFSFKRLRDPVNKSDWTNYGNPAVINAFYSLIDNSIVLPAGILQGVFFNADRTNSMNFGSIGFIMGHEETHGLDNVGRLFDKNGILGNWWDSETEKAFIQKVQCMIDQYSNYTIPELKLNVNGITTQGENIADNGGIKQAYLAYQNWVKRNGKEPQLPGLNFTANQQLWISFGNTWCSKYRDEALKLQILTNAHSPAMFRVNGPLSNSKEFAEDFNCPVGTKMNPEKKCQVW